MTALIVALVVLGASLLIAEAHVVSYGVLGIAGVAALSRSRRSAAAHCSAS